MDKVKILPNRIMYLEIASYIFCLFFATFSHFIYEKCGGSLWLTPFVPINESVWEHSKLLYFPFFFFSLFECIFIKINKRYFFAKALPLAFSLPLMITIYYTYTGVIGRGFTPVDIILALSIVTLMNYTSYSILSGKCLFTKKKLRVAIYIIALLYLVILIVFTYYPPHIALFKDPLTDFYGLSR